MSYMKGTITVRLDEKLEEMLEETARETGRRRSDIVRDALRRQLLLQRFRRLRRQLVPLAQKQGIYTDEDVFRIVS
jgi:predicted transcriptional regulator